MSLFYLLLQRSNSLTDQTLAFTIEAIQLSFIFTKRWSIVDQNLIFIQIFNDIKENVLIKGHIWVWLLLISIISFILQLPVVDPFLEKVSFSDLGKSCYIRNCHLRDLCNFSNSYVERKISLSDKYICFIQTRRVEWINWDRVVYAYAMRVLVKNLSLPESI